jgi:hypothetical protein
LDFSKRHGQMTKDRSIMMPFWLANWAGTLALGWLLPNHYRPWIAFHSDIWIAAALLLAFVALIWRSLGSIAL